MYVEKDFGDLSFVRLTGGKQKLLAKLIKLLPPSIRTDRYIEPFFGGGSLFFSLTPKVARINDANHLLIEMYRLIQKDPVAVHSELVGLAKKHGESFYYQIRTSFNSSHTGHEKAAQLIYLNRSCFNGVFRVNRSGEFNVPWGKKEQIVIPSLVYLERISRLFNNCELMEGDFSKALEGVGLGDFVYLDPPYLPLDATAFFRHYTWPRFNLDDHERLAKYARGAVDRGANVMVSNPNLPIVRDLFSQWHFSEFEVPRTVTANKPHVRRASELIITNYPASLVE